jgi:hypothetical protein
VAVKISLTKNKRPSARNNQSTSYASPPPLPFFYSCSFIPTFNAVTVNSSGSFVSSSSPSMSHLEATRALTQRGRRKKSHKLELTARDNPPSPVTRSVSDLSYAIQCPVFPQLYLTKTPAAHPRPSHLTRHPPYKLRPQPEDK